MLKVKDCYVISANVQIDQQRLDIDTALDEIIGFGIGALLVFGDAELIYYEAEDQVTDGLLRLFINNFHIKYSTIDSITISYTNSFNRIERFRRQLF